MRRGWWVVPGPLHGACAGGPGKEGATVGHEKDGPRRRLMRGARVGGWGLPAAFPLDRGFP